MEYGLVALWLATFLLLLYLGMPIARLVMPDLEDFGAGVALPLALSILWLVAYFVGHLSITAGLWLGVAVLGALAILLPWQFDYEIDHDAFVEVALVFSAAFCFLIAIRAVDPAAHPGGGEKFLDMGLLQSLLRGTTVPPEDAWFAGETVRYYYGGHYMSSLLARMTGTEARYAYNLALAGFYGMLVTAAYGLAGSVAAHRGFSAKRAGMLAAFFVGIASNLKPSLRYGSSLLDAAAADLGPLGIGFALLGDLWHRFADLLLPLPRGSGNDFAALSDFNYWFGSRVIKGVITEFPLFAWLNGDLHAHMMDTAFLLLLAAVLFQVFVAGGERSRTHTLFAVFGVVPAVGGLIAVFNTWSYPAVGGLTVLTLALAPTPPTRLLSLDGLAERVDTPTFRSRWTHLSLREGRRLVLAVLAGVVVLGLAWLWSAPYWLWTTSTTSDPRLWPDRSTLAELLVTHGAFTLLFWLYLYRHGRAALGSTLRALAGIAAAVGLVAVTSPGHTSDVGLSWIKSAQFNLSSIGLFVPVIAVGWILLRWSGIRQRRSAAVDAHDAEDAKPEAKPAVDGGQTIAPLGFETVLMIAAAGLIVLVEFVYVTAAFGSRFNTVFKVYAQVWIFAGVAAGVVMTRLLAEQQPSLGLSGSVGRNIVDPIRRNIVDPISERNTEQWPPSLQWRHIFAALGVLIVACVSVYGIVALGTHFGLAPGKAGATVPYLGVDAPSGWVSMVLWLGGTGVAGMLATRRLTREDSLGLAPPRRHGMRLAVGLLVISAGLYGSLSIVAAFGEEPGWSIQRTEDPTLDALAFVETDHADEADAIYWLNDEVEGQPNMLSDPNTGGGDREGYAWTNGPASLTGVPTLAGWWPEGDYRGSEVYDRRVQDVERMFTGRPAVQRQLLAYYDVELIYVGPNERDEFAPLTVTELDAVTVAKQWQSVTIYRVDQDALSDE